ncbi:MAG: hypothetical protein OXC30_03730 [Alphaproteobacteria bacterium]|nr:hypothetical protein [Alphaproteobacteria bacterium]
MALLFLFILIACHSSVLMSTDQYQQQYEYQQQYGNGSEDGQGFSQEIQGAAQGAYSGTRYAGIAVANKAKHRLTRSLSFFKNKAKRAAQKFGQATMGPCISTGDPILGLMRCFLHHGGGILTQAGQIRQLLRALGTAHPGWAGAKCTQLCMQGPRSIGMDMRIDSPLRAQWNQATKLYNGHKFAFPRSAENTEAFENQVDGSQPLKDAREKKALICALATDKEAQPVEDWDPVQALTSKLALLVNPMAFSRYPGNFPGSENQAQEGSAKDDFAKDVAEIIVAFCNTVCLSGRIFHPNNGERMQIIAEHEIVPACLIGDAQLGDITLSKAWFTPRKGSQQAFMKMVSQGQQAQGVGTTGGFGFGSTGSGGYGPAGIQPGAFGGGGGFLPPPNFAPGGFPPPNNPFAGIGNNFQIAQQGY